jgi:ComF family protein
MKPAAVLERALDLLYPPRCVGCGRFGDYLCGDCETTMTPASEGPRCPNCSARWEHGGNCPRCFHWDALDGGFAAFDMEGAARRAVHALKYRGLRVMAPAMAVHLGALRQRVEFDAAMPVPLHRSRTNARGFNQAEVLLSQLDWPRAPGRLRRIRKTATQVGMHLGERRSNVAGAFAYEGPSLRGLAIALVDDVITTGATGNECARVLRDYGARRVVIVAFARANYEPAAVAIDD